MEIKKTKDGYKIMNADKIRIRTYIDSADFSDFCKDRTLRIPDYIGGIPVSGIAAKMIPSDALVICNGIIFSKLKRCNKVTAALEWLEHTSDFSESQSQKIKKFIKNYSEDMVHGISPEADIKAYNGLLKYAKINNELQQILLDKVRENAEIKAMLLDKLKSPLKKDEFSLDKKKTVSELKKLWGFREDVFYGLSGEEAKDHKRYLITHYKGNDTKVTIPAFIGKTPVIGLKGVLFDNDNIEEIFVEYNPDLEVDCSLINNKSLADQNGCITLRIGERVVLTDCISNASTVKVSEGINEIRYSAFKKCYEAENIYIPKSVKYLSLFNFTSNNKSLKHLYLTDAIEMLDTLTEVNFTIHAPARSYAEAFAKKYGIKFEAIL